MRAGVAVLQIEVPTGPAPSPTSPRRSGEGDVNIEDLQIVHSPEGGRGTVHLTVAADAAGRGGRTCSTAAGLDPTRLA